MALRCFSKIFSNSVFIFVLFPDVSSSPTLRWGCACGELEVAGEDVVAGGSVTARELSPLQEIERRVQARAKDISLDMGGDGGAKLRALIDDEVAAWSIDYRRRLRDFDLADSESVADRAYRNLAGYGPLEPLLEDDDVWEIMVNAPDGTFNES